MPEATTIEKPAAKAKPEAATKTMDLSGDLFLRVRVQNSGGSESVTIKNPTMYDLSAICDAVARLVPSNLTWAVGTAAVIEPGADQDTEGNGAMAVEMVVRWLQ